MMVVVCRPLLIFYFSNSIPYVLQLAVAIAGCRGAKPTARVCLIACLTRQGEALMLGEQWRPGTSCGMLTTRLEKPQWTFEMHNLQARTGSVFRDHSGRVRIFTQQIL